MTLLGYIWLIKKTINLRRKKQRQNTNPFLVVNIKNLMKKEQNFLEKRDTVIHVRNLAQHILL